MIELGDNEFVWRFPEVHADAVCRIGFQRTMRILDDNRGCEAGGPGQRGRDATEEGRGLLADNDAVQPAVVTKVQPARVREGAF